MQLEKGACWTLGVGGVRVGREVQPAAGLALDGSRTGKAAQFFN